MHRAPVRVLALSVASLLLAGCGGGEDPVARSGSADGASATWILASMPAGAVDVEAAKDGLAEGDTIVLRGRIGGSRAPFVNGAASFTIVDPALEYCQPDEGCRTPWDYCCVPRERITAGSATVQVVDADGAPVLADPRALGFEELDLVVVEGTVGPRPDPSVLVIEATGVHRAAEG